MLIKILIFMESNMNETNLVGKGGHGAVYYSKTKPGIAVKITHNGIDCKDLKKEYNLQREAKDVVDFVLKLEDYEDYPIDVPQVYQWKLSTNLVTENNSVTLKDSDRCIFEMDLIISPDNEPYLWQLYLSENDTYDRTNPNRGRYVGPITLLNQLKDLHKKGIIMEEDLFAPLDNMFLNNLSYYAGFLLSIVQYGSLQTAVDTEPVLGLSRDKDYNDQYI